VNESQETCLSLRPQAVRPFSLPSQTGRLSFTRMPAPPSKRGTGCKAAYDAGNLKDSKEQRGTAQGQARYSTGQSPGCLRSRLPSHGLTPSATALSGFQRLGYGATAMVLFGVGMMVGEARNAAYGAFTRGGWCAFRDSWRLNIFCGFTRMTPPRGLSMSAMRKNAIDTTRGRMRS
jgi:hypothetical protein